MSQLIRSAQMADIFRCNFSDGMLIHCRNPVGVRSYGCIGNPDVRYATLEALEFNAVGVKAG